MHLNFMQKWLILYNDGLTESETGLTISLKAALYDVKISYDDKRVYYGQVKGFIPNGQGIMEYPDGSTVIGVFKKGIPNGPVTILENNKKYDGYYKKGECIKKREWLLEV